MAATEQDMLKECAPMTGAAQKPDGDGRAGIDASRTERCRALTRSANPNHSNWLVLIGVLKLFKALLFILLGVGALRLLHKDLVDSLTHLIQALHFDTDSHFVNLMLEKVALINPHRLREISIFIFCYAALDIIEGTGLVLEKPWAEYLTLILTACISSVGTVRDHAPHDLAQSGDPADQHPGGDLPGLPCAGTDAERGPQITPIPSPAHCGSIGKPDKRRLGKGRSATANQGGY
jgi:uncharacterized membrane protein (DUF2068 family)